MDNRYLPFGYSIIPNYFFPGMMAHGNNMICCLHTTSLDVINVLISMNATSVGFK